MTRPRLVVALGGNALAERGAPITARLQSARARIAAEALAPLCAAHDVVVTHGNGPQVGLLLAQDEASPAGGEPSPLDVVGAESEGLIGYLLVQELARALPGRPLAALLTRTVVDPDDPALARPSKPIGPVLDATGAAALRAAGAVVGADGTAERRLVGSPEPLGFLEEVAIRTLVDAGVLVIAAGGGGVPVAPGADGPRGVEAVVDKDLAAVVLAGLVGARTLLLLTDVAAVEVGHGTPGARRLDRLDPAGCRALIASGEAPAGSMAPKLEAAARFAEGGGRAVIAALADAAAAAAGAAGTIVEADRAGPRVADPRR